MNIHECYNNMTQYGSQECTLTPTTPVIITCLLLPELVHVHASTCTRGDHYYAHLLLHAYYSQSYYACHCYMTQSRYMYVVTFTMPVIVT